jgi:phage shock protein C
MEKKLYRDEHRKMIGGVCAGLADYFGVDVSIIRVIFAISMVLKGVGIVPYVILWIVLPKRNSLIDGGFTKPGFNPNFNPNFTNPGFTPGVDYTIPPPPAPGQPFMYTPPKKSSGAGIIFGVVMIVLGSIFLLDNLDFIPELDFDKLWPVILVAIGATLIFTGKSKHTEEPWKTTSTTGPVNDTPAAESTEDKPNDNPTTI